MVRRGDLVAEVDGADGHYGVWVLSFEWKSWNESCVDDGGVAVAHGGDCAEVDDEWTRRKIGNLVGGEACCEGEVGAVAVFEGDC